MYANFTFVHVINAKKLSEVQYCLCHYL